MPIDEEIVRQTIERKLSQWVALFPDPYKPIIGSAGGEESLSPMDILNEVRDRTPEGNRFVERWYQLALEHIIDSDLKVDDEDGAYEEDNDEWDVAGTSSGQ